MASGSYCVMSAAILPGPASVFSLVFRHGSKYAITVSSVNISQTRLYDLSHSGVHCNLAFMLSSSLSGAVACANPSMKSAFAPARNRKEHTSAADCGNLLPSGLLFYLGLVIFLRLRTPSKEFHSSEVEPALPQAKCEPMLAPQLEYVPECFIMLLGHCDED